MSGGACREFKANLFKKNTCQTCFKSKDQHLPQSGEESGAKQRAGSMDGDRAVVKEGFLTKSPPDLNAKFGSKQWKKRWFVLTSDATLTYYESDKTYPKKPLGDINLLECSSVEEGDAAAKQFNCLALTTPNRVYYIKAETKDDIDAWRSALQGQLPTRKSSMARSERTPSTSSAAEATPGGPDGAPSVGPEDASARPRGSSQIAKLRARSMAPETSRRETLSASRRRQGGSMLHAGSSDVANDNDDAARTQDTAASGGSPKNPSTRSSPRADMLSPAGDDWDTLDDVSMRKDASVVVASASDDVVASVQTDTTSNNDVTTERVDEPMTSSGKVSSVTETSQMGSSESSQQSDTSFDVASDSPQPVSSAGATPDMAAHTEQLERRDATVCALQHQLDQRQRMQAELESQVSDLQQKLASATSDIRSAKQQAATQQQSDAEQLQAAQLTCDRLRKETSGLEEKVAGLSTDNAALSAVRDELTTRLESAGDVSESETVRLRGEFSAAQAASQTTVTALSNKLEELSKENSELTTRLECAAQESQTETNRLTTLHETQSKSLSDTVSDLEGKVAELQQRNVALTEAANSSAADASSNGSKVEEVRKEHRKVVEDLQEKVTSLEEQVAAASADEAQRVARRRADSVRLQETHDNLRREVAKRDDQLEELEARLASAQRERDERESALAEVQAQLSEERQSKRRMLDKLAEEGENESQAALAELEREKARMKKENRRSASEYSLQLTELQDQITDMDELRAAGIKQDELIAEQRTQLEAARSDAARTSTDGGDKAAALESQLAQVTQELGDARQCLRQVAADATSGDELQRTLDAKTAELKALEAALHQSSATCEEHKAAAMDAERKFDNTSEQHREEIAALQQQLATVQASANALRRAPKETVVNPNDALVEDLREKTDRLEKQLAEEKSKMQSRQNELRDEVKELRSTAAVTEAARSRLEQDKFDLEEAVREQREELHKLREQHEDSEPGVPTPAPVTQADVHDHASGLPSLVVGGKGKSTVTSGRPSGFPSQSAAFTFPGKSHIAAAKSTNLATDVNSAELSTQKQLDDLQLRNHRLALQAERQKRLDDARASTTSAAAPPARPPSASHARQQVHAAGRSRSASSAPVSPSSPTTSSPFRSWTAGPGKTASRTAATRVESQATALSEPTPPSKPAKPVMNRGTSAPRTALTSLSAA